MLWKIAKKVVVKRFLKKQGFPFCQGVSQWNNQTHPILAEVIRMDTGSGLTTVIKTNIHRPFGSQTRNVEALGFKQINAQVTPVLEKTPHQRGKELQNAGRV